MLVPLILHCTSGQGSEATSTTTVTLGVPESATMTVPSIRSLTAVGLVVVRSVTTGDTERNKIMTDGYMQSLMTTAHTHNSTHTQHLEGHRLRNFGLLCEFDELLLHVFFQRVYMLQQYDPGALNHCVVEYYNQLKSQSSGPRFMFYL